MANFFDPITGAAIGTMEVREGARFRVGLFGGGPAPDYARLNVTTSPAGAPSPDLSAEDPAVKFIHETPKGSWNLIYEIDPGRMLGPNVRACWNGGDYARPLAIKVESTLEIRRSIVNLARSFVASAHYLWGTAGNQPGQSNGNPGGGGKQSAAKLRDYGLDPKATIREKVLAVCTAVQPVFDGYNTCAGRSSLYVFKPDLDPFLAACNAQVAKGKTDQTTWEGAGPQKNLFPRKFYFRGTASNGGAVTWGESCADAFHFDCVGLVNYCYAKHWHKPNFGLGIGAFREAAQGTTPMSGHKDLMDADILLKPGDGHIGMLYGKGSNWFVVQAEETIRGLTENSAFDPKAWDRYRMSGAYLVGKRS